MFVSHFILNFSWTDDGNNNLRSKSNLSWVENNTYEYMLININNYRTYFQDSFGINTNFNK